MNIDSLRRIVDAGAVGTVGTLGLRLVDGLKEARKQLELQALSERERENRYFKLVEAAGEDIHSAIGAELEAVSGAIDEERGRWERKDKRSAGETETLRRREERRLAAMTGEELKGELQDVLTGRRDPEHPALYDELSIPVRPVDGVLHEELRRHMREKNVFEPWRRTELGRELETKRRALENAAKADGVIPVLEDGKPGAVFLSSLLDEEALNVTEV